jgi:RNA polymerase sigma-70 factor (ECF subfamily)
LNQGRSVLVATCDDGLAVFLNVRPRLLRIVYQMLGSAAEAEDIVQDVWVRWQTTDRTLIRNAAAFLATTATRLAINVMQSARARREVHVEPRLPERADGSEDPSAGVERREALASGVLVLLERLTAPERAAYVLREAFDYAYRDIARILRLQESNARQLVARARQHVGDGCRRRANPTEHRRLVEALTAAADIADSPGLERLCTATFNPLNIEGQRS